MPKLAFSALISTLAVACAGGAPAPTTASEPPPETQASAPEDEDTAQLRASFMSECERAPERHEFCECSFDVVTKTLTREEITSTDLSPDKQAQLKAGIVQECTGKLPESTIKKGFVVGCTSQGPGLAGFCDCTWSALRKSAEAGGNRHHGHDRRPARDERGQVLHVGVSAAEAGIHAEERISGRLREAASFSEVL